MSWPMVTLADIGDLRSGFGFPNKYQGKSSGHFPFAKVGDISATARSGEKYISKAGNYVDEIDLKHIKAKTVPAGSIVFAKIGEAIRQNFRAITSVEMLVDNNAMALVPNLEKVNVDYLYHFMCGLELYSYAGATTVPSLRKSVLEGIQIPLPPLTEQKRIAAILDKADAIRRKRQQAIQLADEFLRAVFLDMFGDPVTNPKGWEVVDSGELYLTAPRIGTTTPAKGEGSLVVRVGELGQFNIAFERCGRVKLSEADFDKFVIVPGDTVLARAIGSKNQLGKASYYSGYTESVVIDSHVMRLRPNREICNPEWFYRFVSSDGGKSLLQKAGGATAVQFNINAKQASKIKIPLPPLALQNKFIELCSSYFKYSNNSLVQESMVFDLFKSLSQKAFAGEI